MPKPTTIRQRQALLRAAQAYMRRTYSDPDLSLGDVAAATGSSPRHVQRVFREQAEEDFRTHLLRIRMEAAVRLLTRNKNPLPIHRTARRVGYRQASGLRQAFVRFYGHNPSEIQRAAPEDLYGEVFPD
jgi:transcriptional regulator GlxA family with amidase domain